MQAQSKTDQLIYRISYRNHKKRLTEIKQHNTSLQFYNKGKGRPDDKKKILMLKMKREEIQMENQILQHKINKIQGKTKDQVEMPENHKHKYRYNDEKQPYDKIQVKSDYGDGETKVCIVPYASKKHKKTPYTSSQKRPSHPNPLNSRKGSKIHQNQSNEKKSNSHPHLSQPKYKGSLYTKLGSIRQSISKPQEETLYHEPQKQSNRLVMFKKTRIPEPMLSYLIQISLIKKSILITAYAMGIYSHTLKLVLDPKKSQQLLRQVDDDYEKIWERVLIDSQSQTIRVIDEIASEEIKFPSDSTEKKKDIKTATKLHIQQEFIKRNYYTIKQQNQQKQQTINKEKSIEKPQFKPNPRKATPIFRHTKIGQDWKKQYKPQHQEEQKEQLHKSQQVKVQGIKFKQKKPNESTKLKNQPKIEKKQEKKIQRKQQKKPQKKIQKKPQNKVIENKKKTVENKSESLVESKNQSKVQNIRNTNQEEQKKQMLKESNIISHQENRSQEVEENKEDDEYIEQFQQSPPKQQKLQKSKEIDEQRYEEQFQQDNMKGQQQSYEMEFQDNPSKIKNQSNLKGSNVYEEDFEGEQKNQKKDEVEEDYEAEFDT